MKKLIVLEKISPSVEPAVLSDDLLSFGFVSPVAEHRGVATSHQLSLNRKYGNVLPACALVYNKL